MLIPKENGSLQDISFDFVNYMYGDKLDKKGKEQAFLAFRLLLNNGWTIKELYYTINTYIADMIEKNDVITNPENPNQDILKIFSGKRQRESNLLECGKVYYHNKLRIYPKSGKIDFDYNTGEFTKEEIDYFLEFRASFTMKEISEYYLSKPSLYDEIVGQDNSRIEGSMNWLYKKFQDAELILYMIDAANFDFETSERAKLNSPTSIQDYHAKAIAMRNFKINECKMNGDVKVVPRKRVLSNRSWILDRQEK